ncbi:MAG: WecB/TagA/CpsF family glycosyltransferase [Sphingomonadaceae bacterium]
MKFWFPEDAAHFYQECDLFGRIFAAEKPATIRLFGLDLYNAEQEEAACKIVANARLGQSALVNFVNAHCINQYYRDRHYAAALRASTLILPDGIGIRIASGMMRQPYTDNLNGTDLFPLLCDAAAREGQPLFLLGGAPGVADSAAEQMILRNPDLQIAGTGHGYFSHEDEERLIERINRSGARILLAGFGVPLQETWLHRMRARLDVPVIIGVGGLFDYYSGRIPRAPLPIRKIGCEWIWRLCMEPRRMARRYLLGNMTFIGHALAEMIRQKGLGGRLSRLAKRDLDIALSIVVMILLLPVFAAIAMLIRGEDHGPVFFRQIRVGKDGRNFTCFKFRSMHQNAESRLAALKHANERDAFCFKMREDPRITRVGRWLRRSSLDELPQLWNVMRGEMSLVGPRPALPAEVGAYPDRAMCRLKGKPGMTGLWQVSGRAEIPFDRQVVMDRAYLRCQGIRTDLALLFRTIPAILSGRGAY